MSDLFLTSFAVPDLVVDVVGDDEVEVNVLAPQGPPGPEGPQGVDGPQGPPGPQGEEGLQGDQGVPGTPGATGPTGPTGATGPQGLQGVQGEQGDPGETGATGPEGPQGATGATGPQGATGAAGAQGATGPQGPQGVEGPEGPMGPIGPAAFTPRGDYASGTTYDEGDVVQDDGSTWYSLQDSNTGHTPGSSSAWWQYLALVGAEGPQGEQGPTGAQGPAGATGATGPAGPTGATGSTGPQGLQGDPGEDGATGPQGPQGIQGPTGATGATGAQGPQGEQGETGPEGPEGPAGDPLDVDDGGIPQAKVFNLVRDLDAKADRLNGVVTPLMEPSVGGRVTGLAIDPFDSDHFVIGGDLLGVGYSFDRGETWQRSQGLTGYEVGSVTFCKQRPGWVWVATMSGPELSINGGVSFERKINGLPTSGQEYFRPTEIVLENPTDTDVFYAVGGSHRDWKTSTSDVSNYGKFYRFNVSTDTWTELADVVTDGNIRSADVNSDDTCILVGGAFGLKKSTNGGSTWTDITTATGMPVTPSVWGIQASHTDPDTFFISVSGLIGVRLPAILMTTDKGVTWDDITNDIPAPGLGDAGDNDPPAVNYRVLRLADDDSTLWVGVPNSTNQTSGTHDIVFKTENPGASATWTVGMDNSMKPAGSWPPGVGTQDALAIDPSEPDHVLIGSSNAIFQTDTGGESAGAWRGSDLVVLEDGRVRGRGFAGTVAERVQFSRNVRGRMRLAAFDAANIMHSEDSGYGYEFPSRGWYPYGGGMGIGEGPSSPRTYILLGQGGTFRGLGYAADGRNFTFVEGASAGLPDRDTSVTGRGAVMPISRNGMVALACIGGKLYLTTNGGPGPWTQVGDTTKKFEDLAVDEATLTADGNGTVVYVSDPLNGVYTTTNRGTTTTALSGSPKAATTSGAGYITFDQRRRRLYLAVWQPSSSGGNSVTGSQGAWRYDVSAGTWARIYNDFCTKIVAADWSNPNIIAVGLADGASRDVPRGYGCWISFDDGENFERLDTGMGFQRIRTLGFDPWEPGRLIIGTDGGGFFETRLNPYTDPKVFSTTIQRIEGLRFELDRRPSFAEVLREPAGSLHHRLRKGGTDELVELTGIVPQFETASRDVTPYDSGKAILNNGSSALTFGLPNNPEIAAGEMVVFCRKGTGTLTIQAASGISLNGTPADSVSITNQFGKAWAWKVSATEYLVWGEI